MTINKKPVTELEAKLKPAGSVTMVSAAFADVGLAKAWNKTPGEFEALSEEDQIVIMAYEAARSRLDAVQAELDRNG